MLLYSTFDVVSLLVVHCVVKDFFRLVKKLVQKVVVVELVRVTALEEVSDLPVP